MKEAALETDNLWTGPDLSFRHSIPSTISSDGETRTERICLQCVIVTPQPARQFIILVNTCTQSCTNPHAYTNTVSLTFCRVVEVAENQVVTVSKSTTRSKQLTLSHSSFPRHLTNKRQMFSAKLLPWRRLCWWSSSNDCENVVRALWLLCYCWYLTRIKCERQFSLADTSKWPKKRENKWLYAPMFYIQF